MFKRLCIVAAFALASPIGWAQKGPSENPLFRVRSELVLVDLIVSDKEGNPITDLQESEVEIREDGKRRKVQFFEFFSIPSGTQELSPQAADMPAGDPIALASPRRQTSLAVFLDMPSLEAPVFQRVKESLSDYLQNRSAPETRVMLASFRGGLTIHQSFTSDRQKLIQALEGIQAAPEAQSALASFRQFSQQLEEIFHGAVPGSEPAAQAAAQGKTFVAGMERRMAAVSGALTALSQSLRAVPGRKQVLFFSSGYPMQPMHIVRQLIDKRTRANFGQKSTADLARERGGDGRPALPNPLSADVADTRGTRPADTSLHKERMAAILSGSSGVNLRSRLDAVIDQANRSQVSFYSIDARGLLVSSVSGDAGDRGFVDQLGTEYLAELRDAVTRAPQEFLNDLSEQSGGLAFLNSNDFSTGLSRAESDARSYYLAAYRPDGKGKAGEFKKVEVKLKRSGARARYRQGYLRTDPAAAASEDVLNALRFPALFENYPYEVRVEQAGGKIAFNTVVPTKTLHFREEGGKLRCAVAIYGILLDEEGRWVGNNVYFSRGHDFGSITPAQRDKILTYATFNLTAENQSPAPGEYRMVVVIRQGVDGTLSTHTGTVRVGG